MWKVLIADDDVEILNYLSNLIPWEEHEMQICAKARNGTEALNVLKNEPVDILLTDITMPGLSGLELVKEAKRYQQKMKTIILTCHENFTYAKTAIDLGVCGYMVKYMLEPTSFLKTLKSITMDMSQKKEQEDRVKAMAEEVEQNRSALIEKKLGDLLRRGPITEESARKLAQNLHVSENHIQIAALFFQESSEAAIQEKGILFYAVKNIVAELMAAYPVSYPYACNQEVLVLFFREKVEKRRIAHALAEMEKQVETLLHARLTIVLSMPNNQLSQFAELIERLEQRRNEHFYPGSSCVIWEEEVGHQTDSRTISQASLLKKLHAGDFAGVEQEIHDTFMLFQQQNTAPSIVESFCNSFVRELEEQLYRQGILEQWQATHANSWEGYKKEMEAAFSWFRKVQAAENRKEMRDEIAWVIDYITQNLQKKISCETMANMVNMNAAYFSRLFKKETGESFSDYLSRIRVERATMLLKHSSLSVEEITERVGLSNMHYFYRMYKKHTGTLPGKVRKK